MMKDLDKMILYENEDLILVYHRAATNVRPEAFERHLPGKLI